MSVSPMRTHKAQQIPAVVVDSDVDTDDAELGNELDQLTIEPIAPQKSEHARKVVAAYSEDAIECKNLLLMLGLMADKDI